MTRILHLSDLHFGRDRAELLEPLVTLETELKPDLVAVSGDFTQRARRREFMTAARFLERLGAPWIAVPGNHDISLTNLPLRLLDPWGRYRGFITPDLSPRIDMGGVTAIGLNTVNPMAHESGRIHGRLLRQIATARQESPERTLVVVMHHPLEHPRGLKKPEVRRAREGMSALGEAGADIVLAGHLHTGRVAPFQAAPGILLVQAGTGLSTRVRGEPNMLNLLEIEPGRVNVRRFEAQDQPRFEETGQSVFTRTPGDPTEAWVQSM